MTEAITRQQTTAVLSLADLDKVAKDVAESGLFPRWKTPQEVKVLMLLCQAEGRPAISAVQRYVPINGSPTKTADAMLGDFIAEGGDIEWTELTGERAEAIFYPPGGRKPAKVDFTMDEAREAGLANKDNWRKHRRDMLKARVITRGLRMVYPQATSFMMSAEEVRDGNYDEPMRRPEKQVGPMFTAEQAASADDDEPATETATAGEPIDAEVTNERDFVAMVTDAKLPEAAVTAYLRNIGWLDANTPWQELPEAARAKVVGKFDRFADKVRVLARTMQSEANGAMPNE